MDLSHRQMWSDSWFHQVSFLQIIWILDASCICLSKIQVFSFRAQSSLHHLSPPTLLFLLSRHHYKSCKDNCLFLSNGCGSLQGITSKIHIYRHYKSYACNLNSFELKLCILGIAWCLVLSSWKYLRHLGKCDLTISKNDHNRWVYEPLSGIQNKILDYIHIWHR